MGAGAIVGQRVSLRAIREDDLAAIHGWYEEATKAAWIPHPLPVSRGAGQERSVAPRTDGVLVIDRVGEREVIGIVEYAVKGDWLTVAFIALAKGRRGWGYGSEAVRRLEAWVVREGIAQRFRAEVDMRNGLGLYFWLRLGYRPHPASTNDGRGIMTMVREVETGTGEGWS
jgi:GNAT superfamily N-acetyltransferase